MENKKTNANLKVLDVGCGPFPYKGEKNEDVIGIDFAEEVNPTILYDLFKFPYPFENDTFDKVYASHIMEHMKDNIEFMEEIYRISKPDAEVIIRVPHFSGRSAWCDPTHLRAYSYYQFYYYGSSETASKYGNCEFKVNDIQLRYTRFPHGFFVTKILSPIINYLANLNLKLCEKLWCYWVGGFSEIIVKLQTIKPQRV
ncbi:MAG: SAM-dependent methyltransferase [Colwellia sp.]|jgi:SAM-dependent methyltransferase